MSRLSTRLGFMTAGVLTVVFATSIRAQGTDTSTVKWSVIRIAGAPVGWMRLGVRPLPDGSEVQSRMFLALNRMGSQVVMQTNVVATETSAGRLREVDVTAKMSEQSTSTHVTIDGSRAIVTTRAGDRSFERTIAFDGELLGVEGVRRATQGGLRATGDSIQYREWDGQVNAVSTVTRRLVDIVDVSRRGRTVAARKVIDRSTTSAMPITSWLDSAGTPFRVEYMLPFGLTETIEADSLEAMRAGDGESLPEEQYGRTMVLTRVKLPRAREIDRLRLTLRLTDSTIEIPDLNGPAQRMVRRSSSEVALDITRRRPRLTRASFPVRGTDVTREYLEPNAYIQSDNVELRELAKRVVGTERDLWTASLALQRWVSENMTFDLGVVFAPSVEVFKRRRGTCVAYATILATLTRAVGIPSRIAMGYVYVNGMFGGHAWPEVFVGDEWIALDAAIVGSGPADAARFAFAWSSLAEGPGSLSAGPGAALYGRLAATVESFTIGGVSRTVGASATPYVVSGDRYRNPWMGIELVKPAGFRFSELDATWPAMTVVSMEGGAGERVRVVSKLRTPWVAPAEHAMQELTRVVPHGMAREVKVGGRWGWMREQGGRAVLAVPVGPETWVIEIDGTNAGTLLQRLATSLGLGIPEGR